MKRFALILALTPAPVFAQTAQEEADKGFLVELIEDNLSGGTRSVNIRGFEGALSSQARIAELSVADSEGVWLTLSDVVLEWNRSALFTGVIDVQTLRAGRVVVARAPLSESSGPAAEAVPFALPDLPVSIQLGELSVDRLELGDSFVGEPIVAQIAGAASLGAGEGRFDLSAQRLDGSVGAFELSGDFANETRVLAINLDFSEGPSGIVARLIGLPGRPAVGFQLTGDAPLDDFTADLAISTDGVDRISGDFTLQQVEAGQGFRLDIGGDVTSMFAPEYQTFFGPDVGLFAQGLARSEGGFDLQTLDLSTQSLALQGSALINADGFPNRFDLTGQLADADGRDVLLPLAGTKTYVAGADLVLGFDASVSDDWDIDVTARNFDRDGVLIEELTLKGGGLIQAETGDITANLAYGATGLELDDAALSKALGTQVSGTFELTAAADAATRIDALTLQGAGLDVQAEAQIATDPALKIDSTILAGVADLSRFDDLAGIDLGGGGDLTLISTIQPLDGLYDLLLSGDTADLRTGIDQLDPLLAGAGTLSAKAVRDADGTRLEGLRIATDEAIVTANVTLTNDGGRAAFSVNLADISVSEPTLSGAARLNGTADLNADQAVDFDVELSTLGDVIAVDGTSTPTPDGRTLIADLSLNLAEAARFAPLAGRDIGGRVSGAGNIVLLADQTRFSTELTLDTTNLKTGTAQLDPLLAGDGTWALNLDRLGATRYRLSNLEGRTPWLDLSATATGDLDGAIDANVDLTLPTAARIAPGLPGALRLNAQVARDDDLASDVTATLSGSGTNLNLTAQVAPPDEGYAITGDLDVIAQSLRPFSRLAGRSLSGGITAQLSGSTLPDLSVLNADISADSTGLGIGIDAVDKLLRGTGRYSATLSRDGDQISVPAVSIRTPALSVSGQLESRGAQGDGTFNARLSDIGLFTDQLSGPVTAQGRADRRAGLWNIDVGAIGPGGLTANADGSVSDELRLNLDLDGAVPLGLANDILDPRRITGTARYNLQVRGPAALGSVSGTIETSGARLAVPSLAQALENIDATIRLQNSQAQLAVQADVQTGGSVTVNGPVSLDAPFNGDLTARLNRIKLKDPELYQTTLDGTIAVNGPLAGGARISGTLNLGETEVRVPSSGIGALGALPDVSHFGAPLPVRTTLNRANVQAPKAQAAAASTGADYPLNITVLAPNRIFVRGRGLDAELGGQLRLEGSTNAIVPDGQFSLIRGRLDILQQRFQLTEGSASLQGDFEPYIRLAATTEANTGTIIQIIVEGPASEPEVRFQSTPELPQDEVLSQLIFGRNLSDISPLQAVQLASAIGTLAGRGGGGIIDNVRQSLNLNEFDITTDDAGNAAVRAGAYVSENVYTDVTVSSDGSTEVNLNLDITDEITARGSVDADGETSVGIFFQRDY